MSKKMSFMDLPEAEPDWLTTGLVKIVETDTLYYHEAGKTRMESWGIAVFEQETGYQVYRYLRDTSFHYGG